jgi:two-component system cell cycle sensor histidine kinase/response regulator CckA
MKSSLRFASWPLRLKMAVLLVVATLLPLAVAAFKDIRESRQQLVATTEALLAARGDQLVGEMDTFHRGYQRSVQHLGRLPDVVAFTQAPGEKEALAAREILEVWCAVDPKIRGVAILDSSGVVRLGTEHQLAGVDLSYRGYVREALQGAAVVSDVYIAEAEVGATPTIAYAVPVRGADGVVVGLVALWVRATALWEIATASNALAGPGSFAVLFDQHGIRVAHTYSQDMIFRPGGIIDAQTTDELIAERRFGDKTRDLLREVRGFPEQFDRARASSPDRAVFRGFAPVNQKWNYGVARRMDTVPWTLFYMIPELSFDAQITKMTRERTFAAAAIILIALLAGASFVSLILKPVGFLSQATEKIAVGDLAARVSVTQGDELGRLGASFNSMASRIEGQATALARARDDLEIEVERRTAELVRTTKSLEIEIGERRRTEEALRESEQSLATTLDSIGDAVIATDVDGRIVRMNPVAETLTGWTRPEARGRQLAEIFRIASEDTRSPVENPVARVLREGVVVGLANHTVLISRDGTERVIADSGAPIRDAENRLRGVVLVFRDQTAERAAGQALGRASEALRKSEEQLRQSQKLEAVGRLAAGIAHDFNNLLSVILSYASMLLSGLKSENPMTADLEEIKRAGGRAADLTRQLLAFSRQQVLDPKILDLNEVVSNVNTMLTRVLGEDVELTMLLAPGLGSVKADRGQIEQVLMNLVVNARDAMPNGGKLTVETANVRLDETSAQRHIDVTPGAYVMISVSDTGIGMDKSTQARIFEPFFTTKERGKGTGLGLATVFGIVKQSGGNIWLYSEPGRGTTFKIYLSQAAGTPDENATGDAPAEETSGTETILLVEDEEQVRVVASGILRRAGYHVLVAGGPGEALLISEQHAVRIHLLLTDVVMPKMNGRQLAERIASMRPDIKMIFMSGYTDNVIVHHGVLDSGVAFFQKPFTPETLTRKVRLVLDRDAKRSTPA